MSFDSIPWLSLLWFLPAAFGLAVFAASRPGPMGDKGPRWVALFGAALVFFYSLLLWFPYEAGPGRFHLVESGHSYGFGIHYTLGLDGLSLLMCWLNAFLTLAAILCSWAQELPPGFWACFLFFEAAVMGVFLVRDLFYFYIFWELSLIPMFFIIGLWGGKNRLKAALKFLLYTVFGGLCLLVGFLALVTLHHNSTGVWSWSMTELAAGAASHASSRWVFLALAVGFAVKVPLFPFHSWLPDAHTEAPTGGSVVLAGVMLKMGLYGFLRVLFPCFPPIAKDFLPFLGALGAFNVIYGALCAMSQTDLKRLVAFTSISHMGFCVLGIASLTAQGLDGAGLQMVNHGISTGALFVLVGILYERTHRRGLGDFGGLASRAPMLAFFFGVVVLSSIGLPGLNGFVGEALTLIGMARVRPDIAAAALVGVVLAAAYALPAYQKVFWAPPGPGSVSGQVDDVGLRERGLLWTFSALIFAIGLYPGPLLRVLEPSFRGLVQ